MHVRMTLADYFEKTVRSTVPIQMRRRQASAAHPGKNQFHNILNSMTVGPTAKNHELRGMTLTDYRTNPVTVRYGLIPEKKHAVQITAETQVPAVKDDKDAICRQPAPFVPADENVEKQAVHKMKNSRLEEKTPALERTSERQIIDGCIKSAATKYDLPERLIHLVVEAESGYRTRVISRAGARGLMQLMPETAKDLGVSDPFDISQNIEGGARYLREMMDRFKGDMRLALAAYNAGPGNVSRYQGIPPFKETRQYVHGIMKKFEEIV